MGEADAGEREVQLRAALCKRRVVVTRAGPQGSALVHRLQQLGATVLHCPAIAFAEPVDVAPLHDAIDRIDQYDWIVFTSANAVSVLAGQLVSRRGTRRCELPFIASVGASTSAAVMSNGWPVHFTPSLSSGAVLGAELPAPRDARVVLFRADLALPDLPNELRRRGLRVDDIIAYRTVQNPHIAEVGALLASDSIDAVTFTSPSTVTHFLDVARRVGWSEVSRGTVALACIGPTTAAALGAQCSAPVVIATEQTMEGLIDALASALIARVRAQPAFRST